MGKIAIFDDRIEDAERLQKELAKYIENEKIYIKDNFDYEFIENNVIDLLFLDIELDSQNGIEEAIKIRLQKAIDINIIFFSNYDIYMQKAMIIRPIYFIRKQYLADDLKKAWQVLELNDFRLRRRISNNVKSIPVTKIMYIESNNKYIYFHYENNKSIRERDKLDNIEKEIIKETFVRCHKSYIVNFRCVDIRDNDKFLMLDGKYIHISRKYHKNVIRKWQEYIMKVQI